MSFTKRIKSQLGKADLVCMDLKRGKVWRLSPLEFTRVGAGLASASQHFGYADNNECLS